MDIDKTASPWSRYKLTRTFTALGVLGVLGAATVGCDPGREPPKQAPLSNRASPLVVGTDDRSELFEGGMFNDSAAWMQTGRSVPALVATGRLTQNSNGATLSPVSGLKLCPGEKFKGQKEAAECTAALVGDDLILTAMHCVNDPTMGGNLLPIRKVVFGFAVDPPSTSSEGRTTFSNQEIYTPVSIVAGKWGGGEDWAIVKLDRTVHPFFKRLSIADYEPKFSSNPSLATQVYMVGYQMGKPAKLSREGQTVVSTFPTFRARIDGMKGNSGSPLFDKATHKIVGILNTGDEDLVWDAAASCYHYFVCPNDSCNETFQSAALFRSLIPARAPSCAGACGGFSREGCWCDDACAGFGDCCTDKQASCPSTVSACNDSCGVQSPSGCWCDALCANVGDCCQTFFQSCSMR